jgi:hypothetical protein
MAKADFAACLILEWDLVSDQAIHRGRECYVPGTEALHAQLQETVVQ